MGLTPNIIEERQMNIAIFDVFSRLMMDRIIFLVQLSMTKLPILFKLNYFFWKVLTLQKDIQIYINSPGEVFMPVGDL